MTSLARYPTSIRLASILRQAGIVTVKQLARTTEAELLALPRFTQACLNEVRDLKRVIGPTYQGNVNDAQRGLWGLPTISEAVKAAGAARG